MQWEGSGMRNYTIFYKSEQVCYLDGILNVTSGGKLVNFICRKHKNTEAQILQIIAVLQGTQLYENCTSG